MRGGGHDPRIRETAAEMYIHQGCSPKEIAETLSIPEGTIKRWKWEDQWEVDRSNQASEPFAQTCGYLMRTMHRMSERLYQSTIPPDPNSDFFLPDENLELRINRLSLAVERIMPMGNMLHIRQRVDVVKEIKEFAFTAVAKGEMEEHALVTGFKILEGYLNTLEPHYKKAT